MITFYPEFVEAHNLLKTKLKSSFTLIFNAAGFPSVPAGDLVFVYNKLSHQKRRKCIDSKKILLLDLETQSVSYPGNQTNSVDREKKLVRRRQSEIQSMRAKTQSADDA